MIVKMIKNLESKMEKIEESINKDLDELKNKHTETNNTTTEIKNKGKKVKSLSHVQLVAMPWTVAYQAPLIFQARVLEWIAISFVRGSSQPRDRTWVSHSACGCFIFRTNREAPKTL